MRVRWLKGATESLRAVAAHIRLDNPAAALAVVRTIRLSVERLEQFPLSGRKGEVTGTREIVLPTLPYILVYRVTDDEVHILRIFHSARQVRDE